MSAANGLRPALAELAPSRKDRTLTASDIALLADGRKELQPFADCLRADHEVQERVADRWNSIVQDGRDHEPPYVFAVQMITDTKRQWDDHWLLHTQKWYGSL
mgnify:CR=1 FL=1